LAIANADGSSQKVVFSKAGIFAKPSWSPDGTKIVFVSDGSNLPGRGIYVLSIDRAVGQALGVPTKIAPLNSTFFANPVWSPVQIQDSMGSSRHFVAYTDESSPNANDYSIYLVDPNVPGSAFKLNSSIPRTSTESNISVAWSPDATRLAVSRGFDGSQTPPYDIEIVTLNASPCPIGEPVCETQTRQSLVRDIVGSPLFTATDMNHPAWENSGEEIAITAALPPNDGNDIWIIPVANPQAAWNLTDTNKAHLPDRHETQPTWSADGAQLAYRGQGNLCNSKYKSSPISLRNVDGTLFPDGCKEKILIEGGNFPSWWRNHVPLQP
jgi:Tol biopolymer transport system component